MSDSLRPHGPHSPWNSPGQNTRGGSYSLLQGVFPTQGSNRGLLHCRQILYQLNHQGSPRKLEWVAYPLFSIRILSGLQSFVFLFFYYLGVCFLSSRVLFKNSLVAKRRSYSLPGVKKKKVDHMQRSGMGLHISTAVLAVRRLWSTAFNSLEENKS